MSCSLEIQMSNFHGIIEIINNKNKNIHVNHKIAICTIFLSRKNVKAAR